MFFLFLLFYICISTWVFFYHSCRNSRRTGDFCHARLFVFIFIFLNFVPFFSDIRGFLRQRLHFNFNIWNSPPIFGGFNNKSDICVYGDIDVRTYIGIYICGRSMVAAAAVKHHLCRCRYAYVLRFQQQYITQSIYGGTSGTWQCGLMPIPVPIPNHSLHVLEAWPHSLLMPDPPDGFRK